MLIHNYWLVLHSGALTNHLIFSDRFVKIWKLRGGRSKLHQLEALTEEAICEGILWFDKLIISYSGRCNCAPRSHKQLVQNCTSCKMLDCKYLLHWTFHHCVSRLCVCINLVLCTFLSSRSQNTPVGILCFVLMMFWQSLWIYWSLGNQWHDQFPMTFWALDSAWFVTKLYSKVLFLYIPLIQRKRAVTIIIFAWCYFLTWFRGLQ